MDTNDQYYIRGGKILKAKMDRIFYILIKELLATKKERTAFISSGSARTESPTQVLEGSLWYDVPSPSEVDDYRTLEKTVQLQSLEFEDVTLRCSSQDVQRLDATQYELLVAVPACLDRFKVFQDTSWMAEAVNSMYPEAIVYVLKMPSLPDRATAKIHFRGHLKGKCGLWFGVELSAEYHGKGTTNGNYLGDSLFSCFLDSGFFLPVNKLRQCYAKGVYHDANEGAVGMGGTMGSVGSMMTTGMGTLGGRPDSPEVNEYYNSPNPEELPPNLEVGERVVWISDEGDEHGEVKWIGRLPDAKNKEWTVGVEFDKPIGTGTGKYNNRQLFRAKHNHASLIPLLGLMKEDAFINTIPPLPPLEENAYENSSVGEGGQMLITPEPPPPPSPPAEEADEEEEGETEEDVDIQDGGGSTFKPRSVRGAMSTAMSTASTNKYADTTSSGTTGSHTPNSDDVLTPQPQRSSTEEMLEALKRPSSATSTKYHTTASSNKSRTTTPSTPDSAASHRYNTAPHKPRPSPSSASSSASSKPQGPKPPEKQRPIVVEKSIYDTDPDNPYENVERPPSDFSDDDNDGGMGFGVNGGLPDAMYRTGKAFAADDPLYEPLDSRKSKTAALCREVDYAPLECRKQLQQQQHEELRNHYPMVNPTDGSPRHSNSSTPLDPRPFPTHDFPPPAYPANAPTPSSDSPASTPRSASQMSNHSAAYTEGNVPGHYTWNSSNYGSTVRTLGGSTTLTESNTVLTGSTTSQLTNESSTPTEHSYFTSRTHLTNSTITSPDHQVINHRPHTHPYLFHDDPHSSYNSLPHLPSTTTHYQQHEAGNNGNGTNEQQAIVMSTPTSPRRRTPATPVEHAHTQPQPPQVQQHEASGSLWKPVALQHWEIEGELEIGSLVEVEGNPADCRYGVIRWIGYLRDKHKPIAGLEMEIESKSLKDGTFGGTKLFDCPQSKGFFIYLHKLKNDSRFAEAAKYAERSDSLAFGSLECPDIEELCDIPEVEEDNVAVFCGKHKGIQGHHNSCYLDATLFSMFAFSVAFDPILFRQKQKEDIKAYTEVQKVLRDGIVNPLRRNFYVRADKVLKLRQLLDKLSSIKGLMTEEKDPEEFMNCLLQQILRAEPLLKLSSGQDAYLYQLFLEPDERIKTTPTTQQLLGLSFLQANIKLREVPSCLVLQMPRFGKDYKMYKRIVPSLTIDITGILEAGPRECAICGKVATYECKDCLWVFGDGTNLDQVSLCDECNANSHRHPKRVKHRPQELDLSPEYKQFVSERTQEGRLPMVPKQSMELFAVVCIETSHYVAFVKSGPGEQAPWLFFDSMADRMGEQNGYNVPEVRPCSPYLPDWLKEDNANQILSMPDDKQLPEMMKRVLCDGYICMYQSTTMTMYK